MADLKKMVNGWFEQTRAEGETGSALHYLLLNIAAEIKANRKEIQKLKDSTNIHFVAHHAEDCRE